MMPRPCACRSLYSSFTSSAASAKLVEPLLDVVCDSTDVLDLEVEARTPSERRIRPDPNRLSSRDEDTGDRADWRAAHHGVGTRDGPSPARSVVLAGLARGGRTRLPPAGSPRGRRAPVVRRRRSGRAAGRSGTTTRSSSHGRRRPRARVQQLGFDRRRVVLAHEEGRVAAGRRSRGDTLGEVAAPGMSVRQRRGESIGGSSVSAPGAPLQAAGRDPHAGADDDRRTGRGSASQDLDVVLRSTAVPDCDARDGSDTGTGRAQRTRRCSRSSQRAPAVAATAPR